MDVVLDRRQAYVRAIEPDNEQIGVMSNIAHAAGQRVHAITISVYLVLAIGMVAGAALSARLPGPWGDVLLWVTIGAAFLGMTLLVRFVPETVLINKPRSESFFARTRDDFIVNGLFTVVGAALGYGVGRIT